MTKLSRKLGLIVILSVAGKAVLAVLTLWQGSRLADAGTHASAGKFRL